ncbi:MAG: Uma2 family endonuclease [Spirulinaceae cyanobacterium SM2_1_0]|nr:Uma2 family endonuclease [Spirulinaceae cyanobacterium SM2_1_0]
MTLTPIRPDTSIEPFYPDSDGQPMAESDVARDNLIYAVEALKRHFRNRPDVYVSGNLFIYYQQGVRDAVVAPDVFVVMGAGNHARKSYKVWEENGLTPDFIIEITSQSTRNADSTDKPNLYARFGVAEYIQFDPSGDYLRPALQGFRLIDGVYQPIDASPSPHELTLHSDLLDLDLRAEAGELRFYKPETSERLLSYQESEDARQTAEAARQTAEAARQTAETARQAAEAARDSERQARLDAVTNLLALGLSITDIAAALALPVAVVEEICDRPSNP